jgi:hypothetical protein
MKVVWKISVPVNVLTASFTNSFHLPAGAKFLHCREQHDALSLWFEVDTEARSIQFFGTGVGPIREGLEYVGTVIFSDGNLVLHIYEVTS